MKTNIRLGKSVSELLDSSMYDSMYYPLYKSFSRSVNNRLWSSVDISIWIPINNSTIWEIDL